MRFTIEQRHLTDGSGKLLPSPNSVMFYACEACDVDDAIRLFVRRRSAEVIGNVLTFPGLQAVATMRNPDGVFTLQVAPASGSHVVP